MMLDHLSGPWRCRWTQGLRTELEELFLTVAGGTVSGSGIDADGVFDYTGTIRDNGSVALTKTYSVAVIKVPPALTYLGRWDGRCIAGLWMDDQDPCHNRGPFRMWPGVGQGPGLSSERANDLEDKAEAELVLVKRQPR